MWMKIIYMLPTWIKTVTKQFYYNLRLYNTIKQDTREKKKRLQ